MTTNTRAPLGAAWGLLGVPGDEQMLHALPGAHIQRAPGPHHALLGAQAAVAVAGPRIALVIGGPRWADARLAEIAHSRGQAHALLQAHTRFGADTPAQLRGAFGIALMDAERNELLLATDRFGRVPLYYAPLAGGIGFATAPALLRAHPAAATDLDPQALFDYVYAHVVPGPQSIYRGQQKLLAAHRLHWRRGAFTVEPYWLPTFAGTARPNEGELVAELHAHIQSAVGDLADESTGAFLSGGLDSSTVAGALAQLHPGTTRSYTIGFDAAAYDERHYARISARHFNTHARERVLEPHDVIDALPTLAAQCDEPFGNSSLLATYACAQFAAAEGCTHLLAGDGGDELFGGNARYARQRLFAPYERLPAFAQARLAQWGPRLPGKLASYIAQARIPLPDRLQAQNFIHTLDARTMFTPELLAEVDIEQPLQLQRAHYERVQGAPLDRMLYLDWQWTLADNDLRKVGTACRAAGVAVDYPLLDERIVDLACRLPANMKLRGGKLRWFFRRAMRGYLPPEVLAKRKHGFGLPFGVWLRADPRLQALAYDNLLALRARNLLQPGFIDSAIELHRHGHADYYGELVWVLMMLELWLQTHAPSAPSPTNVRESVPASCPKA